MNRHSPHYMSLGGRGLPGHLRNVSPSRRDRRHQRWGKAGPGAAAIRRPVGIAAEAVGVIPRRRGIPGHLKLVNGIGQRVQVNARPDNHVAVELAVLLEVHPLRIVRRQAGPVVVGHRHRHIHDPFLLPAIPVRIHVIVRPGGLKRGAGGRRRRGIPGDKRTRLPDLGAGLLNARIHLPREGGDLIAPPLLELLAGGGRVAAQPVTGVIARDAGGVEPLGGRLEPDIVVMNAVNPPIRAAGPGGRLKVHQVHVGID